MENLLANSKARNRVRTGDAWLKLCALESRS